MDNQENLEHCSMSNFGLVTRWTLRKPAFDQWEAIFCNSSVKNAGWTDLYKINNLLEQPIRITIWTEQQTEDRKDIFCIGACLLSELKFVSFFFINHHRMFFLPSPLSLQILDTKVWVMPHSHFLRKGKERGKRTSLSWSCLERFPFSS